MYEHDYPAIWNIDLQKLDHGEIVHQLGLPDIDMAAKDSQLWVKENWWGKYILDIGSRNCCSEKTRPSYAEISIYLNGRYEPISHKTLFVSNGTPTLEFLTRSVSKNDHNLFSSMYFTKISDPTLNVGAECNGIKK